jgi:hypothetical protein
MSSRRSRDSTHERGHRTRNARSFLVLTFFMQRLADAAVIWFTFRPEEPAIIFRGIAIGSCVWTTTFLIGTWRRFRWARYLLTTCNWGYIVVFSFWALQQWAEFTGTLFDPRYVLIAGILLYLGANLILIRSRRVRNFAKV